MKSKNQTIDLTVIPGVGKSIAKDLNNLGIFKAEQLKNKDPEVLYSKSNSLVGQAQDRCLLYVFRCAVYYANGGQDKEKLKWWNWKDKWLKKTSYSYMDCQKALSNLKG